MLFGFRGSLSLRSKRAEIVVLKEAWKRECWFFTKQLCISGKRAVVFVVKCEISSSMKEKKLNSEN